MNCGQTVQWKIGQRRNVVENQIEKKDRKRFIGCHKFDALYANRKREEVETLRTITSLVSMKAHLLHYFKIEFKWLFSVIASKKKVFLCRVSSWVLNSAAVANSCLIIEQLKFYGQNKDIFALWCGKLLNW